MKQFGRAIGAALGLTAAGADAHAETGKNADAPITYRLVWFELQIAPFTYRFAIVPNQPILIGMIGEGAAKGVTMLIRHDHVPEVFDRTVEQVNSIVRKSGVMKLTPVNPDQAFNQTTLKGETVHLRLAYADNQSFASLYSTDEIPAEVATLIAETRKLAQELVEHQSSTKIEGDQAHEYLNTTKQVPESMSASVILKIRVSAAGSVSVDDTTVTLAQLGKLLDTLVAKKGNVWYYREAGNSAPSAETNAVIKQVLDAVMVRKLPIKLQETKY